jgi:hypothetical protein
MRVNTDNEAGRAFGWTTSVGSDVDGVGEVPCIAALMSASRVLLEMGVDMVVERIDNYSRL